MLAAQVAGCSRDAGLPASPYTLKLRLSHRATKRVANLATLLKLQLATSPQSELVLNGVNVCKLGYESGVFSRDAFALSPQLQASKRRVCFLAQKANCVLSFERGYEKAPSGIGQESDGASPGVGRAW
jgi:hypothetical protein